MKLLSLNGKWQMKRTTDIEVEKKRISKTLSLKEFKEQLTLRSLVDSY